MVTLDQAGRGRPWITMSGAPACLAPWVEHRWIERYPPDLPAALAWKVVPDASPHLIAHEHAGRRSLRLVGPRSSAVEFPLSRRRWTVGVRLRPGTLGLLLRERADRLLDRGLSMRDAFGREGVELLDRVRGADGPRAVDRTLMAFLVRRFGESSHPDRRVRGFLATPATRVGQVARALELSPRTLRYVVRHEVGMPPSRVLRIRRLFGAVRLGTAPGRISWSGIAYEAGYSDQAHLIREFNELLGESPVAYRSRRG